MNRQACDITLPRRKIGLWTPWGLLNVADPERAPERPSRRRPKRGEAETERDGLRGRRAADRNAR